MMMVVVVMVMMVVMVIVMMMVMVMVMVMVVVVVVSMVVSMVMVVFVAPSTHLLTHPLLPMTHPLLPPTHSLIPSARPQAFVGTTSNPEQVVYGVTHVHVTAAKDRTYYMHFIKVSS